MSLTLSETQIFCTAEGYMKPVYVLSWFRLEWRVPSASTTDAYRTTIPYDPIFRSNTRTRNTNISRSQTRIVLRSRPSVGKSVVVNHAKLRTCVNSSTSRRTWWWNSVRAAPPTSHHLTFGVNPDCESPRRTTIGRTHVCGHANWRRLSCQPFLHGRLPLAAKPSTPTTMSALRATTFVTQTLQLGALQPLNVNVSNAS